MGVWRAERGRLHTTVEECAEERAAHEHRHVHAGPGLAREKDVALGETEVVLNVAQRCARRVSRTCSMTVPASGTSGTSSRFSGDSPRKRCIMCPMVSPGRRSSAEWKERRRTRSRSLPESATTPAASTRTWRLTAPDRASSSRSISRWELAASETSRRRRDGTPACGPPSPGVIPRLFISEPPKGDEGDGDGGYHGHRAAWHWLK